MIVIFYLLDKSSNPMDKHACTSFSVRIFHLDMRETGNN